MHPVQPCMAGQKNKHAMTWTQGIYTPKLASIGTATICAGDQALQTVTLLPKLLCRVQLELCEVDDAGEKVAVGDADEGMGRSAERRGWGLSSSVSCSYFSPCCSYTLSAGTTPSLSQLDPQIRLAHACIFIAAEHCILHNCSWGKKGQHT